MECKSSLIDTREGAEKKTGARGVGLGECVRGSIMKFCSSETLRLQARAAVDELQGEAKDAWWLPLIRQPLCTRAGRISRIR
jgi:hypothetical protein